jgi:VanZ family protein
MKAMRLRKLILYLAWLLVLAWMLLIFQFSSQVAEDSSRLSSGLTEVIVDTIAQVMPNAHWDLEGFHTFVRKNAHFFAYLILGVLVRFALGRSVVRGRKGIAIAFAVCVLYAISDEIHQLSVPGRSGQVSDVLIDSAGAALGLALYLGVGRLARNRKAV